jgi:hypothetical protein
MRLDDRDLARFAPKPSLWRRIRETIGFLPDSLWYTLGLGLVVSYSALAVVTLFYLLDWNMVVGWLAGMGVSLVAMLLYHRWLQQRP